ncbi:hypothetical protein CAOG_05612 [Capsaspora owczarzaki ATCC 30864]|uniref:hypothetical protein n=1 Tax=Capsaspora owczarzaki (strain ATCC 30864) TaxID=595528 RepID=UPI00035226C4|nr:hypothetical protein CAOG_05612 [Capsaspora owczarzaki ATCC 30864]|eukprot:XP_004346285.2 hypothetical protein CAOG_05612 [Capsaspora owczarzaki ATCC 30864]
MSTLSQDANISLSNEVLTFTVKLVETSAIHDWKNAEHLNAAIQRASSNKTYNKAKCTLTVSMNAVRLTTADGTVLLDTKLANIMATTINKIDMKSKLISLTVLHTEPGSQPFVAWTLKRSGAPAFTMHKSIVTVFHAAFARIQDNASGNHEVETGA